MSAWKLVEAVPEESPAKAAQDNQGGRGNNAGRGASSGRGRGGGRGSSSGRGYAGRGSNGGDYTAYLSAADRNYLSHMAVQQLEYIFDLDNLCMDTFVRSYMDEAGFVPLPLLCTYQNVAAYGAPYVDVVERLNELTAERKIEFDPSNETVRLKVGWENWLMPNATGGKGVPRYVKQTPEQQQAYLQQQQATFESEQAAEEAAPAVDSA
eukprot:CAMPEP_0184972052 /NCGR_PEP_ID=MMETSP1098-20130426/4113_1 /TAXON_ID=89044 /ORGANISM="Spumella elongata, Strain CCAP 955/1" /LENGTH=208 /DNA_ID=CAMNT_0027494269 /DNA_START=59 /DNA_END=685 /DNA_ORIENTATION=-